MTVVTGHKFIDKEDISHEEMWRIIEETRKATERAGGQPFGFPQPQFPGPQQFPTDNDMWKRIIGDNTSSGTGVRYSDPFAQVISSSLNAVNQSVSLGQSQTFAEGHSYAEG